MPDSGRAKCSSNPSHYTTITTILKATHFNTATTAYEVKKYEHRGLVVRQPSLAWRKQRPKENFTSK